jgi:hypothetical protein
MLPFHDQDGGLEGDLVGLRLRGNIINGPTTVVLCFCFLLLCFCCWLTSVWYILFFTVLLRSLSLPIPTHTHINLHVHNHFHAHPHTQGSIGDELKLDELPGGAKINYRVDICPASDGRDFAVRKERMDDNGLTDIKGNPYSGYTYCNVLLEVSVAVHCSAVQSCTVSYSLLSSSLL